MMKLFYISLAFFFVAGAVVEFLVTRKENPDYYNWRDFRSSLFLMATAGVVDTALKVVVAFLLLRLHAYSIFSFGYDWWVWVLCYLVWDFVFYVKHYLEHNVRFMWAIHVNHHSSQYMNLSTSLRSGVFKGSYRYFFWAIPIIIGFPVPMFLILYGLAKVWAFFSHSQKMGSWGFLEKVAITPTHHLLHHSYNENNLNKNFGETFLIWDKLFGTFRKTSEPLKYGIGENVNPANLREVVFHEFRAMRRDLQSAKDWRTRLKIIFGKPVSYP